MAQSTSPESGSEPARVCYEIVGVLPRGFFVPASGSSGRVDAFYLGVSPALDSGRAGGIANPVIARLSPGVTLDQARAEIAVIAADVARANAAAGKRVVPPESIEVNTLQAGLFLLYRPHLWLITAAVALVLVLASVNLTVLLLARLQSRRHETAIRAALGASRARLARVVVFECLVVCLASAVAALLACRVVQDAIHALVPSALQASTVRILDLRLLAITAGVTVMGAILAGGFPALRLSRTSVSALLAQTGGRTTSALPGRRVLLAAEAALGVLLVAGALVTVRSFAGIVLEHPGFVAEDLYELSTGAGWENRWPMKEAWRDDRAPAMLQIARTLPGVRHAGVGTGLPTEGNAGTQAFWKARGQWGAEFGVTGGYFEALGTEIRAGRAIVDDDVTTGTNAAVLSEAGARVLWPGEPPSHALGRSFTYLDGSSKTVVGIVADFNRVPGESPHPQLFLPFGTRGLGAARRTCMCRSGCSRAFAQTEMRSIAGYAPCGDGAGRASSTCRTTWSRGSVSHASRRRCSPHWPSSRWSSRRSGSSRSRASSRLVASSRWAFASLSAPPHAMHAASSCALPWHRC